MRKILFEVLNEVDISMIDIKIWLTWLPFFQIPPLGTLYATTADISINLALECVIHKSNKLWIERWKWNIKINFITPQIKNVVYSLTIEISSLLNNSQASVIDKSTTYPIPL